MEIRKTLEDLDLLHNSGLTREHKYKIIDYIKVIQVKADKWDALNEEIGKFYNDECSREYVNLFDIGELCAIKFGYL